MKRKCKECYYAGQKKCFMYDKEYKEIPNCSEYLLDPYAISDGQIVLEKNFDFDTWLENQPEGTFIQGGGIDNE